MPVVIVVPQLQDAANLALDRVQIVQLQKDDGISDVRDLVQVTQTLDDQLADGAAGDLARGLCPEACLDPADEPVDSRLRYRALGACRQDAAAQLGAV